VDFDINWLAVLVGTIAHQALGALWYAVLFRKTWIAAMGMNPDEIQSESPGGEMAFGTVASFLSVMALAVIMASSGAASVGAGVGWGALTGSCFVFASTVMNGMYEQKKPVVLVIFGSYYTLGLMIAGGILGVWQ
jgi:hypothetical protein